MTHLRTWAAYNTAGSACDPARASVWSAICRYQLAQHWSTPEPMKSRLPRWSWLVVAEAPEDL